MNYRLVLPATLTLALSAIAPAHAAESPLAPLSFLAGHCWNTIIDDGRESNTHC
jgi:hypothetical protein